MKIEIVKATAPASWASYLINGDASGLHYDVDFDDEKLEALLSEIEAFAKSLGSASGHCVDAEEVGFRHSDDAGQLPGNKCEYTFHVRA